ncbi:MAG: STAS domain-containing protein [Gammaproteobacteria bacterium]|nr:STAS domain-containing protein [Gammaproteobacteria bacterium]
MSISVNSAKDGKVIISIKDRFDFNIHQDFRNAYENIDPMPDSFEIDLRATSYLDSSALGMLLLLRDYAGDDHSTVSITNANAEVSKILTISNFDQLFTIS